MPLLSRPRLSLGTALVPSQGLARHKISVSFFSGQDLPTAAFLFFSRSHFFSPPTLIWHNRPTADGWHLCQFFIVFFRSLCDFGPLGRCLIVRCAAFSGHVGHLSMVCRLRRAVSPDPLSLLCCAPFDSHFSFSSKGQHYWLFFSRICLSGFPGAARPGDIPPAYPIYLHEFCHSYFPSSTPPLPQSLIILMIDDKARTPPLL